MKYTLNNFYDVFVDCNGWSREEAKDSYKEYRGDLEAQLRNMGCDTEQIEEMHAFIA